jgi:hypothetical protein
MYAVIRRYNSYEGMSDKIVQRVNQGFVPLISAMRGFISYYLLDGGDGMIATVSVFEDRQGADDSTQAASEWVRKNIANMIKTAPVIVTGAVSAHAARAGQAIPGGVVADRRPAPTPGVNPSESRR